MSHPFLDTNILIRFLDDTDPVPQAQAAILFGKIQDGVITVVAPEIIFTEAVYVLASKRLFALSRAQVRELLRPILLLPRLRIVHRRRLLRALDLWNGASIKWGDALIAAEMEAAGERRLYSFDAHFDRLPSIERLSPDAPLREAA